jgi:hypothetical protein
MEAFLEIVSLIVMGLGVSVSISLWVSQDPPGHFFATAGWMCALIFCIIILQRQ